MSPKKWSQRILAGTPTFSATALIRLQRAADLLRQNAGTVAEIAYQVGFGSPSYFTKVFRKYFGKLPSEFVEQ